jgi:hypothetical protein
VVDCFDFQSVRFRIWNCLRSEGKEVLRSSGCNGLSRNLPGLRGLPRSRLIVGREEETATQPIGRITHPARVAVL